MENTTFLKSLSVIITFGITLFFFSCKNDLNSTVPKKQNSIKPKVISGKDNTYEAMRYMALQVKPKDLNLSFETDKIIVYGMVLDWEMNGAIATTVAFQTGDASMYLSTGGAIIGGGTHEKVSDAAKMWVAIAQQYQQQAKPTTETPLPEANSVIIYFITNTGLYTASENVSNLEDKSSYWLPLFTEANKVITELRKIDQNQ